MSSSLVRTGGMFAALIVLGWAFPLSGCTSADAKDDHASRKHGHVSHRGGHIAAIGDHHVEVVMERGGQVRVFVLGADESVLLPVAATELRGEVTGHSREASPITLKAVRADGEPDGSASEFEGRLPLELAGLPTTMQLTVPVDGKRYRARIELAPHKQDEIDPEMAALLDNHSDTAMPSGAAPSEETDLYGTPGGIYSEADIRANGKEPASVRFRGIASEHDMNPKPGDRICPITNTKANPKFSWSVGGKSYLFCCPPCVDEFVKRAKTTPTEIKAPSDYVKQAE